MSEYEYDKNKPGQTAGAGNDTVSGDAGSGMASSARTATAQHRSSGSDAAWENDDWSMRSSSVSDDDDPLIKLARLMEQNERNFEAAAQRSNQSGAGAPAEPYGQTVDQTAHNQNAQNQHAQAYHPEPQTSSAAASPEPVYQRPPVDSGFVPASDLPDQGHDPYSGPPASEPDTAVSEAPRLPRAEPAAFRDQADDGQYDPFAPGGSAQPLPERDFDVSRIPRAIRPSVSVDQSQMDGLHGSASPDQAETEPAAEPSVTMRAQRPTMPAAAALREPIRPQASATRQDPVQAESEQADPVQATQVQADPIAAELMRYVDANEASAPVSSNAASAVPMSASRPLQENAVPGSQSQQPQTQPQTQPQSPVGSGVQPASELGSSPTPQPDFSYLREVEDLRVPPRDAARDESADSLSANPDAAPSDTPPAEDADILYEGYEEEESGSLFASRGMMVAAGVMAFVLLGGGALLAYQAIFSSDDGSPPPLVLADKNPVRMLPDGQAADTSGSGDIPLTNEGDVSNGVIQPGAETPIARINPNIDPDRAVRQIGVDGNGSGSEAIAPRSVRTFKVNPDGSIVAEPATTIDSNSNAIQPRSVTTQQISGNGDVAATAAQSDGTPLPRARPGEASNTATNTTISTAINANDGSTGIQPRIVASNDTGASGRADLPVPPRVSVGTNAPSFNQNAPSVQPSANSATARVPSAAIAPTAPAAQPPAPAAAGDFVVQVSSQRSEEAARTAFSGLQRRFPSVLGNSSPDIARADLGARGVFYRVRVGPMETRVAAADFCQSLKNAGGDCIVARR